MGLDRFVNKAGLGKYALINLRTNTVEWGTTDDDAFFVIKLKDIAALDALDAYAKKIEAIAMEKQDHEQAALVRYADDIRFLATRAAENPHKKIPD